VSASGLAAIVRCLGGALYAGGRRASVPGPGHSRADRSVSLALVDGRVLIHSFAGDDWRHVRDDLLRRGLIDREGRPLGAGALVGVAALPSAAGRQRIAQRLWSEGGPLAGSAAARHLLRRGLGTMESEALRAHPSVASAVYLERGIRRPALLAAIRGVDGVLAGVEVTYLSPDGDRAAVRTPRKTVGRRPAGSAVRLARPGAELLVGEGVFTALSAGRRFQLPAWALMAAANLAAWAPPEGVRRVLVAVDRDAAGARAAWTLRRRLRTVGLRCDLCWPPQPFADWNEALLAEREGEAGPEGMGAADGWSEAAGPEIPAMTDPLIPVDLRARLRANAELGDAQDPVPVLKLFNPAGPGTWLITEMAADGDLLFGLCDLDMGCPELGYVSQSELTVVRLPFGLSIERDLHFEGLAPLSVWADAARSAGSIREAEAIVRRLSSADPSTPA
jgi:hypothetical protein